jgi:hypothetical protein
MISLKSWHMPAAFTKAAGYTVGAFVLVCAVSFGAHQLFFASASTRSDDAFVTAAARDVSGRPGRSTAPVRASDGVAIDSPALPRSSAGISAPVDTPPPVQSIDGAAPSDAPPSPTGWLESIAKLADGLPFTKRGSGVSGLPAGAATAPAAPVARTAGAGPSSGGAVQDVFFSTSEGMACHSSERQFILNDVPDLYVCAQFVGVTGKHVAKVIFLLPDGNVYQTMTVPFMTIDTPGTVDPMIEVDGRELEARRAGWGASGASFITVPLPVSGTFISQYGLGGLWTVRVVLDGRASNEGQFDFLLN